MQLKCLLQKPIPVLQRVPQITQLVMIFIIAFTLTVFNLLEKPVISHLQWQVGYIYFPAAIPVTIGVIAGSPIGSKLARILSSKTIQILFGIFILIVMIEKSIQLFRLWID